MGIEGNNFLLNLNQNAEDMHNKEVKHFDRYMPAAINIILASLKMY